MMAVAVQESAIHGRVVRAKRFLRGVMSELKKVSWPDKRALSAYTAVVFVSVFFTATVIWLVDNFYTWVLQAFLKQ